MAQTSGDIDQQELSSTPAPGLPPPPTPTAPNATADQPVTSVPRSTADRVGGVLSGILKAAGGNTTQLDQNLQQHYDQRMAEAKMNQQHYTLYATILAHAHQTADAQHPFGVDPTTGQPLTQDQYQYYTQAMNSSQAAFEKSAGVNKQAKDMIAKAKGIVQHIVGSLPGQPAGAGASPAGAPNPAAAAAPGAAGVGNGAGGAASGPGLPPPPPPMGAGGASAAAAGPSFPPPPPQMLQQELDDYRTGQQEDTKQRIISKYKVQEEQAKAKADAEAKAANPSSRPVIGPSLSVSNARTLAQQGKTFNDRDGNPIDLTSLPDTMGLKNIIWGGKSFYEPFSPNSKIVTVGNEEIAVSPMDVAAITQGAGTDLGAKNVGSTTRTTDPVTGQTTVAIHTPATAGRPGAQGSSSAAVPATVSKPTVPHTSARATPLSPAAQQLDDSGHIPITANQTPQVIEGANQLLDGTDKDKLPTKTRELSAKLARQYGWEQGKFTPKEQVMLRESTTYLQRALVDPSLSVLDESVPERLQLSQVLSHTDDKGLFARVITTEAAKNLSPQQAAFARMYNQLVGTISGLGSLVRSGRITEATINRLKSELPNPTTTKDSADARDKIKRLLSEIDVARQNGNFEGDGTSRKSAAPPTTNTPTVIKWGRDANGKPVPLSSGAN